MQTRRNFIQHSSLLTAGFLLGGDPFFNARKKNVGLQMYTLRKVVNNNNIGQVLEKVAAIGYKELEVFGYDLKNKFWGLDAKPFRKLLKANGLAAPSAHIAFENFLTGKDESEFQVICDAATTIGNKYIVVTWLAEQHRKTKDDYKLVAEKLNKAGRIASQYGLQLAYHNHDFEFNKLEDETTGYEIILNNTDANLVKMELDIYWTVKAGIDPVTLFTDHTGRFPLWHIKDMDKITRTFTETGAGSIDFKKIFEYKKTAGLQHFFVEQDEIKKDAFESIKESFDFVSKNLV